MNIRNLTMVVFGDSNVGKTALISKAKNENYFEVEDCQTSAGPSYAELTIGQADKRIQLKVWDFPGAERLKELRGQYLRDATFVMVCCDAGNNNPQAALQPHIDFVRRTDKAIPIFIVLTKSDLVAGQAMNKAYIDELTANDQNRHFLGEVSAKNQSKDEIKGFFKKTLEFLTLAVAKREAQKEAMKAFFEKYDELKAKEKTPYLFRRTHVERDNETFESLLQNARHKRSTKITTNQAFLKLGWFNGKKEVTDAAPQAVKDADLVLKSSPQFKK